LPIRDERFDHGDHLRCIPFGGANQSPDFPTLSIDQDGSGQAKEPKRESGLARWIDVDAQVLDRDLGIELLNDLRSAPINRERNDFEVGAPSSASKRSSVGISVRQGPHQVAQRLSRTTFPWKFSIVRG
jgi:hypothetical protein